MGRVLDGNPQATVMNRQQRIHRQALRNRVRWGTSPHGKDMDPVTIHSQTGAVANRSTLRGTMIPLESLVGTRCMNRWDEGSWDTDPHRHGRFTIIAVRG